MTSPTCPHCGAESTVPILGLGDKVGAVFKTLFRGGASVASFSNPGYLEQFESGKIEAVCTRCGRKLRAAPGPRPTAPTNATHGRSTAERLKELQELQAQGFVSEEEYVAQRRRILDEL